MLANLFTNGNSATTTSSSAGQLQKTAELTAIATTIANEIMKKIESNESEFAPKVLASQASNDKMDELIAECYNFSILNLDFMKGTSEDDIDKMIRSQQSKRSRSKSKVMTLEAYKTMMVGAICEYILRTVGNKPKSANGGAKAKNLDYSDEQLQKFATDRDALNREIRNVQSKKSIMKSKANFDENSEAWLKLLDAEKMLKDMRESAVPVRDERLDKLQELVGADLDIEKMKGNDAKGLLSKIKELFTSDEKEPANEQQGDAPIAKEG